MSTPYQGWPRREEYDLAMKEWQRTLQDPELRAGQLARDGFGIRRPGGAGLYVCSYRVDPWFIRCFCASPTQQPPHDIIERYRAIAAFTQEHAFHIPALVPITLLEQGIQVGQRFLPVVKMPLVAHATPLGRFVERHKSNAAMLALLGSAWVKMIDELEKAPLAHGDLDLTNVLIQQTQAAQVVLVPRLIDYDDMWVPTLAGRAQTEHGHEPFQHPAFLPPNARPYAADMDRFSALVIYLGICGLARRPGLYDEWGADDTHQWLIGQNDYRDPDRADGRLAALAKLRGLDPYVEELRIALHNRRMPESLPALVARVGPALAAGDIATTASASVGANAAAYVTGGASSFYTSGATPATVPLDYARPPIATFGSSTRTASVDPYPTNRPPAAASTPLYTGASTPASSAGRAGPYGFMPPHGSTPGTSAAKKSNNSGWVFAGLLIVLGLILLGILLISH